MMKRLRTSDDEAVRALNKRDERPQVQLPVGLSSPREVVEHVIEGGVGPCHGVYMWAGEGREGGGEGRVAVVQ